MPVSVDSDSASRLRAPPPAYQRLTDAMQRRLITVPRVAKLSTIPAVNKLIWDSNRPHERDYLYALLEGLAGFDNGDSMHDVLLANISGFDALLTPGVIQSLGKRLQGAIKSVEAAEKARQSTLGRANRFMIGA